MRIAVAVAVAVAVGLASMACSRRDKSTFARDTPPDGLYHATETNDPPRAGALPARRGTRATWLVPGAPLRARRALLFSESNDNSRFQLLLWLEGESAVREAALIVGGAALLSEGGGSDNGVSTLNFELASSEAAGASRVLSITRQDRHPVPQRIAAAFAPTHPSYVIGDPVEVVLTLDNPPGAPTVTINRGGRQRGPRDNQFSFTITRDGAAVAPVDGQDFGGISQMQPFAPTTRMELRASLDRWAKLDRAGHYDVTCSYETTISPDGARPHEDDQRGAVWDITFTGRVAFDIR